MPSNKHPVKAYVSDEVLSILNRDRRNISMSSFIGDLLYMYAEEMKNVDQENGLVNV